MEFLMRKRGNFEESFYSKIALNYLKKCTKGAQISPLKKYYILGKIL